MQNPHRYHSRRAETVARRQLIRRIWLFPFAFFLVACLPESVRLPESELLRYFERTSGLIAYLGVDGNVYTIDQAGRNQIAVTDDAVAPGGAGQFQIYQHLAWSPDSRRLGFVGASGNQAGVYEMTILVNEQGAEGVQKAFASDHEAPFYLYWAPDSEQISFLASSVEANALLLEVTSVSGGDVQVVDIGNPYYWAWGPDGDQIAVHVGGVEGGRMGVLTLDWSCLSGGLITPRRCLMPLPGPRTEQNSCWPSKMASFPARWSWPGRMDRSSKSWRI